MLGGAVRGGKVPLGLMWDQGETITTYPMGNDGSNDTHYDRADIVATLRQILAPATAIYTLNPDTVSFIEHPDHIYAARITRVVEQSLNRSVPISYHVTYPTGGLPKNLGADATQHKRDEVASYFAIDGDDNGEHVFGESVGRQLGRAPLLDGGEHDRRGPRVSSAFEPARQRVFEPMPDVTRTRSRADPRRMHRRSNAELALAAGSGAAGHAQQFAARR